MKMLGAEKEGSGKFCNGPRRNAGTWKRRNEDAEQGWDARDLSRINAKDFTEENAMCHCAFHVYFINWTWKPCCAMQGKAFSFFAALSPSVK